MTGREVVDGVVAPLLVDRLVVGVGAGRAEQQRVAVGRGGNDAVHPDDAAGAVDVLDDHCWPKKLAHASADDAAHDVERAARGKGHHDMIGREG